MKEFLSLWGFGRFRVSSQGMWAKSLTFFLSDPQYMFLFGTQPKLMKQKSVTTSPEKQIQGVHPNVISTIYGKTIIIIIITIIIIIIRSPFRDLFPFSVSSCGSFKNRFQENFYRSLFGIVISPIVSPKMFVSPQSFTSQQKPTVGVFFRQGIFPKFRGENSKNI